MSGSFHPPGRASPALTDTPMARAHTEREWRGTRKHNQPPKRTHSGMFVRIALYTDGHWLQSPAERGTT
jgi:hypothetical protein